MSEPKKPLSLNEAREYTTFELRSRPLPAPGNENEDFWMPCGMSKFIETAIMRLQKYRLDNPRYEYQLFARRNKGRYQKVDA